MDEDGTADGDAFLPPAPPLPKLKSAIIGGASSSLSAPKKAKGRGFCQDIDANCSSHLAGSGFESLTTEGGAGLQRGKTGPAFMFSHARNIIAGPKQDRQLMTGLYTMAGIYCSNCGEELGWKYIQAYQERQKFKEGRFIIERAKIAKEY